MNSTGGIYGRQLKITADQDDQFLNNEQTVKTSLAQDKPFALFEANALLGVGFRRHRADQPAACRPSSGTSTPRWPATPTSSGRSARSASTASARRTRSPPSRTTSRRSRSSATASPTRRSSARPSIQASFEKYPSAKVVFFDNQLQFRQADLSADVSKIKEKGAQLIFTCIDGNESVILGKELVKQHVNAVQQLPNAYDQKYIKENAQYLEGAFVAPQFQAFEYEPQLAEAKLFQEWMQKGNLTVTELSTEGWIAANMFVHRPEARRPQLHPAEADRLAQPGHRVRRQRHDRADQLDVPAQRSAPAPTERRSRSTRTRTTARPACGSTNGKFVALKTPPGLPWICTSGGPNAPTLTKKPVYRTFKPGTEIDTTPAAG